MQITYEPSPIQGIKLKRDSDDTLFLNYFNKVQSEAAKQHGRVFFLETSEGNQQTSDTMECSDLSGWLIEEKDIKDFESGWRAGTSTVSERFWDDWCVAEWSGDPTDPDIEFKFYDYAK